MPRTTHALRFKPANDDKKQYTDNQTDKKDSSRSTSANGAKGNAGHDGYSGKVYVLKNSELLPVKVRLGITDNRNTEILAGELKAGDPLVTGETQAANNGQSSSSQPLRMRMF